MRKTGSPALGAFSPLMLPHDRGRGHFLFALQLFAFASNLAFAEVNISAAVDRTKVALNESFQISVTISGQGNIPSPQLPDLSAFTVYSSGRSQNISFVNGQIFTSITYRYQLTPKSIGTFTIAPFLVTVDGKTYSSSPLILEVVSAPATPPPSSPQQTPPAQAASAFVKLSLSKSRVYLNEEVILSFRFYHRLRLVSNPEYRAPDLTGFLVEDLPPPKNFTEQVNGVSYQVTEIKTALFPARTGVLKIAPAELRIRVQDLSMDPFSDDFFRNFFGGGVKEYLLRTEPVTLNVLPLPEEGKPANFSGGVGKFRISSVLDKKKLSVGEPFTLTVSVEGRGNIKSLGELQFPDFEGFRKYDTASSLNLDKSKGYVEGSKVYKMVLVPQSSGEKELPAISFNYFDPEAKEYRRLRSAPLRIEVLPGKTSGSPAFTFQSPEIKRLASEIRYIKMESPASFEWLYRTRAFKVLCLIPLAALFFSGIYRGKIMLEERNPERKRMREAYREAGRLLKEVESDLDKNKLEEAAQKLFSALRKYLADKSLSVPAELSFQGTKEFLEHSNVNPNLRTEIESLWKNLELVCYAPAEFSREEIRRLQKEELKILQQLEQHLRALRARLLKGKRLLLLLFLFSASLAKTEQGDSKIELTFQRANQFYQEGKFQEALQLYQELESISNSMVLQYNLGNAHYRLGQTGKAILHWIRAYRMNPRDSDVKYNLSLVSARAGESYFSENLILRAFEELLYLLNFNELSILLLLVWWGSAGYWVILLIGKIRFQRVKNSVFLLTLILFWSWWLIRWNKEGREIWAVTTRPIVEVRSGPGNQFSVGFTVPEGRRLLILREGTGAVQATGENNWIEVGVPSEGLKGWVEKEWVSKI